MSFHRIEKKLYHGGTTANQYELVRGGRIPRLFVMDASKWTQAERIDYARRLERIESLKAEKRMKAGKTDPMETFPQGTTRDTVASKLGIGSGKQYEKEKYIVENQESLTPEDFADWDEGKYSKPIKTV